MTTSSLSLSNSFPCACPLPCGKTVKEGLYEIFSDSVMLPGVSG